MKIKTFIVHIIEIKIMKDLIISILLIVAIYSGATAANSQDFYVNIPMAILCGVACEIYSRLIKDSEKD